MGDIVVKSTLYHIDVDPDGSDRHVRLKGPKGAKGDQGPAGPPNTGSFASDFDLTSNTYALDSRYEVVEATYADPWHDAKYVNGFETYTDTNPDWNIGARYRMHREMTWLEGLIRRPGGGYTPMPAIVIPTLYAPSMPLTFAAMTSTGLGLVTMDDDGALYLTSGGQDWIQLFGIKFGPALYD